MVQLVLLCFLPHVARLRPTTVAGLPLVLVFVSVRGPLLFSSRTGSPLLLLPGLSCRVARGALGAALATAAARSGSLLITNRSPWRVRSLWLGCQVLPRLLVEARGVRLREGQAAVEQEVQVVKRVLVEFRLADLRRSGMVRRQVPSHPPRGA